MSDTKNSNPDNPLKVDGVGESQEARQADLAPECREIRCCRVT